MGPVGKKKRDRRRVIKRDRQRIALNYMYRLAELAQDPRFKHKQDRYAYLIKHIGMKSQQPIPRELKLLFCRSCLTWFRLEPEPTVRIRTRARPVPHIIYTCLKCGRIRRLPFPRRSAQAAKKTNKEQKD